MGKFEKLVVLIVLFLSAVVLAVSSGKSDEAGTSPTALGGDDVAHAATRTDDLFHAAPTSETKAQRPARVETPVAKNASTDSATTRLLLDAGGPAKTATRDLKAETPGRILKSTAGLKPSLVEDFMQYTVRDGDTWVGLAKRFYRDARQAANLRVANDDPSSLRPGMAILVPVSDLTREAGQRDPFTPATVERKVAKRRDAPAPRKAEKKVAAATEAAPVAGTTYTVQDGDNLSKISKKVYGTTTRWQSIYAANKGVMKNADWLSVGMKLVIPAAGDAKPVVKSTSGVR